ncbi:DMT family transporter [uncultured Phycicoccus sp.]|uniref:DMT family transporter n=1 Tax=uncultured Phycicoccus sp. TaxID=661422 RepID=UPI00261B4B73|nr:DMT family transporter [uncultured Phycicoccus sp.]
MVQPRVPWQAKFVALVLIWGSSFLLMKVGLESLGPVQISALRTATGAVVVTSLLVLGGGRLPSGARVWGHLVVCGFFLAALPFTLFALSETRISSALAGIGNAATPIATVLATLALLPGAGLTGRRVVAVVVGFAGVVTIMEPWTSASGPDLLGFAMALGGGASYGVGWTYNRRFLAGADLGGLAMPAATLLTGLALMVPVSLTWAATSGGGLGALTRTVPATDVPGWLPLACVLVLGVVGTGFAYVLQFDVVRGAGPLVGSTITYLIPVVSVLLGVLVLRERLGLWQVVGFAVVLAAAWVVNRTPRSPEAVVVRSREQGVVVVQGLEGDGRAPERALRDEPGDDRGHAERRQREDRGAWSGGERVEDA